MASSSSTSCVPTSGWTYEVFISFRGEDTRNNFVDHLYENLDQRGIRVFKDDIMLGGGKPISSELIKAIKESRFAVVVFSKNYANSSWCLEELAEIMEFHDPKKDTVIPVFYHVDPSDVRKQNGHFATAFHQHEKKFIRPKNNVNKWWKALTAVAYIWGSASEQQEVESFRREKDKLHRWREALTAAANKSGHHISATSGGESEVIKKIVNEVDRIKPLSTEKDLIGIESHMNKLYSLLGMKKETFALQNREVMKETEEARMVGIWGMGGIGKTTIAKALFGRISFKFEGSSFVHDVREKSKKAICEIQNTILKDILVTHHQGITDPENGAAVIQTRFREKKVLIVLDDVDSVKQLEFLAATHEWFGPGSIIIITTRDQHVLSEEYKIRYEPSCLLTDQAVELFSIHAFKKNSPPDEYEDLSNRVVQYTRCLPLAVKVLGSYFHGRPSVDVWEDALQKLADTPNDDIFSRLKLSFDGLDVYEKKIFLDIACFFKGEERERVTRVLASCDLHPLIGIDNLIKKSLITVSRERLNMHDLLQEMGWQVVHQDYPNSRLWQLEQIHDFFQENTDLMEVEAIVAPNQNGHDDQYDEKLGYKADIFDSMKKLRILDLKQNFTCSKPIILPPGLRWLCWNNYPFSSLPLARINKLVGLEMIRGEIKHLWEGQKVMHNLKFIRLQDLMSLTRFPDISKAPNIERLILSSCMSLEEVDDSLGFQEKLVYLEIKNCWKLKRFPSRIEMKSLKTLIMSRSSLERLPEFSPCMVKLSHVDFDNCHLITEVPSSIRYLSNLSFLSLDTCNSLVNIPNCIHKLKHLKTLRLHDCLILRKLPKEFGSMENLQDLQLGSLSWRCPYPGPGESINFNALMNLSCLIKLDLSWRQIREEDFPIDLHGLSSLESLSLRGNLMLIQLPASISHLASLKYLELQLCNQLQSLHGLPSRIQVLNSNYCDSLEKIEDLTEKYESLYKIWLHNYHKLPKDEDSGRYLDKMLEQSFLKKCAAVGRSLSIILPGNKIPSWFEKQQHGEDIVLYLRPEWQTQVVGFAVCNVFPYQIPLRPRIRFRFKNGKTLSLKVEDVSISPSAAAAAPNGYQMLIAYIPFILLQQNDDDDDSFQSEDWSHIVEGNLFVRTTINDFGACCGAQVVYKEDVKSYQLNQQVKPSTTSYWDWELHRRAGDNISFHDTHYNRTDLLQHTYQS